jgi:tripartite ATP-independent transporter DctM subunit
MDIALFWLIIMALGLGAGILSGIPVVVVLAGVPLVVAFVASQFGQFDITYLAAFPQRIYGIMNNPLLIAIPLFVLMGVLLEQSRQAEKMLLNISALLGQTKSTLVIAVLLVSTLIAASTGIIGATIVMLGMISLPALLNSGVSKRMSSGLICASGTLGQIIPPSIVLILLGDQISNAYIEAQQSAGNFAPDPVSVGHLFAGALIPGLLLVSLYAVYTLTSLFVQKRKQKPSVFQEKPVEAQPLPNVSILTIIGNILPPLLLIIAVLGSILFGVATPTESAAIGVAGTLLVAAYNLETAPRHLKQLCVVTVIALIGLFVMQRAGITRIDFTTGSLVFDAGSIIGAVLAGAVFASLVYCFYWLAGTGVLRTALTKTTEVTAMVFGIIVAASMLSLVFRGFEGDEYVHTFFSNVPGGTWGMLVVTMLVIFLLGFVLEFVEIIFIVIPIVGPIILQGDFHPVWFAILIALNIQTSFLTPPFGFALFYYRSVAPPNITTIDIYLSVIPYVLLQLLAITIVVNFPALATWLPDLLFN